jgi:predicted membrane-bound spermidine synthase
MILEITATKIVAPYFGNSLYIWTSLIGIMLGGLSIGYLVGGKIADKEVNSRRLSLILLFNTILCLFIYFFSLQILSYIFSHLHFVVLAALISITFIFTPACICFGMISPYISKLYITDLKHTGRSIGMLYFISTIGSISGTFLAGFYLLSVLDSFNIILLIALTLSICSIVINSKHYYIFKFSILVFVIYLLFIHSNNIYTLNVFRKHTENHSYILRAIIPSSYAEYFITEIHNPNLGTIRNLITNFNAVQSSYIVSKPQILQSPYTRYFTLPNCYKEKNNVLMIGGGGFIYPSYSLKYTPKNEITVVEIDPKLTQIAETYFDLPLNNKKIKIENSDGRLFLNKNEINYDAIIMDAFDYNLIPFQLVTYEAITKIYSSLNSDGIVIMNIVDSVSKNKINFLGSEYKTYKSLFPKVEIYQVNNNLNLSNRQNFILVAYKNNNATNLQEDCLFNTNHFYKNKIDMSIQNGLILTDKFAPIDRLLE